MAEEEGCSSISHPSAGTWASKRRQSGSMQRKQRGGKEGRCEGTHTLLAARVLWARRQRAGREGTGLEGGSLSRLPSQRF